MSVSKQSFGPLVCRVVDGRQPVRRVAVLCHGFGAPGTDLVPFGGMLLEAVPDLPVRFVFPEAPLSLAGQGMPDGRAWWYLNVAELNAMIARGELRDQRGGLPDGAAEASAQLQESVLAMSEASGVPISQFVLGGFSQGSMVATDVALRLEERPAGLCVMSGTLLAESEWSTLAAARGPMPVLQSHGRVDPILPFQGAIWLRDMLLEAGLPVDFHEFHGLHEIPPEVLQRLLAMLATDL